MARWAGYAGRDMALLGLLKARLRQAESMTGLSRPWQGVPLASLTARHVEVSAGRRQARDEDQGETSIRPRISLIRINPAGIQPGDTAAPKSVLERLAEAEPSQIFQIHTGRDIGSFGNKRRSKPALFLIQPSIPATNVQRAGPTHPFQQEM